MNEKLRVRKFYIPFLAFLCILAGAAHAANNYTFSDSEKAAFAFFHFAKGTPAYEGWVQNSAPYMNAPEAQKPNVYEQEMLRLKWGFGTLDITREDLRIKTDVLLQLNHDKDVDVLNFKFVNSGSQEIPYFSYPYGKEWIAVVVNDLGDYTTVPLNTDESAKIRQRLEQGKVYQGKVSLRVRPVSSDSTKPLQLDNTEQWLMLAKVSGIEFLMPDSAGQETALWAYSNKAMLTETEQMLMPLLEKAEQ